MFAPSDNVTELLTMEHLHVPKERFNLLIVHVRETLHSAQCLRLHAETTAAPDGHRRANRAGLWLGAEHRLELREIRGLPPTVVGLRINPVIAGDLCALDPLDQVRHIDDSVN